MISQNTWIGLNDINVEYVYSPMIGKIEAIDNDNNGSNNKFIIKII